mmetsp:Transcript_4406/g.9931  ORF Transcript_4406/g.9931 Transcript_4406/m.9931 type:complete len:313 (-) Transcript_4406:189-1127(-)
MMSPWDNNNKNSLQQQHLDRHRIILIENALLKIKARNAYLCSLNTDHSQWRRKTGGPKRFQEVNSIKESPQVLNVALNPTYACPWTLHRTNIVSETKPFPKFDGGKWTCGLVYMKRRRRIGGTRNNPATSCVVYSFGSNDVIQQKSDCEVHIFDPRMSKPPEEWKTLKNYHFHPSGLCAGGDNVSRFTLKGTGTSSGTDGKFIGGEDVWFPCKTLQTYMSELGHAHVDILKADAEGMEWSLTRDWGGNGTADGTGSTLLSSLSIGQLLMEFHFWHDEGRGTQKCIYALAKAHYSLGADGIFPTNNRTSGGDH